MGVAREGFGGAGDLGTQSENLNILCKLEVVK